MKNKYAIAAIAGLAVAGTVAVMRMYCKKHSGCKDCYPDVDDEGEWEDPDIEKEFADEADTKKMK